MELRHLPYYSFIILFSCVEPTLVPDQDCRGVIGGEAVADECGVCEGLGKTGCDSTCGSTLQLDCEGECGGDTTTDCHGVCGGNSFTDNFCKVNENGTFNLDSLSLECFSENENSNCRPNTDSCLYVDCKVDTNTIYIETVIDCKFRLPSEELETCNSEICTDYRDYKGDGECDFGFTHCEEFEFDGGDCDLIDCNGLHFSNDFCIEKWGYGCVGDGSSLGDDFCDDGNDEELPVNFNCEGWGFDGAECLCEEDDNGENDCWDKTSPGNYDCPSEGVISGGDCSD